MDMYCNNFLTEENYQAWKNRSNNNMLKEAGIDFAMKPSNEEIQNYRLQAFFYVRGYFKRNGGQHENQYVVFTRSREDALKLVNHWNYKAISQRDRDIFYTFYLAN